MQGRGKRLFVVLVALCALLSVTAGTATAKPSSVAAKKKAKKTKKTTKKTTKRITKKVVTTTAKPTNRVISSPSGATTSVTGRARPKDVDPDGELIFSFPAPIQSLDPAKNSYTTYTYPLYDRLTYVDDKLNVVPMLATGWSYPNKSTMDMTLRNDVVFEDGTKFDAAAVKANIERSKTLSGSLLSGLLKGVASVEAVSPTLARFHLASGGTELPSLFATSAGEMISAKVIASGVSLDTSTHGGGSGAYTVDSFSAGDKVVYKQSKTVLDGTYWDKGTGLLKKFSWVYLATSPQRINAVRSGDLDVAQVTGSDAAYAESQIKAGQFQGRSVGLQLTEVFLQMRQTRAPFDNKTFRTAIQYAIDKQLLGDSIYSGQCEPSSQFYTPNHWSFSPTVDRMYKFDHDKAQKMIKDSGLFNPTFTLQYEPLFQAPATAVAGMLGDYGINVKLQGVASGDLSFRDGQADAKLGAGSGQVDPASYVRTYMLDVFKLYNDSDGSLEKALQTASDPTINQATAAKLYDGIWQKIADQSVQVDLCHTRQVWIHKGKVANIGDFGFTFVGLPDARYLYVRK